MCEVLPAARRLYALAAGCFGVFFTAAAAVSIGCSRIPFYTVQPAVLAAFGLSAAAVLVLAWQGWRRLWRFLRWHTAGFRLCRHPVRWPVIPTLPFPTATG